MNKQPETQSVSVEERDEVVKQFLSDKEEADIKMHPFNRRLGSFVVSRDDIKSLLHTHSLATEEKLIREIISRGRMTENPIEHNGEQVDGSFYQVYKGNFENWLKAHDQKLLQAVIDTARGIGAPPRVTEQVTHQTYNDGKRDFLADLIALITPIE